MKILIFLCLDANGSYVFSFNNLIFGSNALSLTRALNVVDAIESPNGKFPSTLGNVIILEKFFVESLILETLSSPLLAGIGSNFKLDVS